MSTEQTTMDQVRGLVDRAVKAAVPAEQMFERKLRPDSEFGFREARPLAGLQAALLVARLATAEAYKFAKGLRGEGTSWLELADLLDIPWSEEYVRRERAYELVAGPPGSTYSGRSLYWTCGGPNGCGKYVTDRGPYEHHPRDNETGHADDCRRAAAEVQAWEWETEERERRGRIMDEAMEQVTAAAEAKTPASPAWRFGLECVGRARYVEAHGGRWLGWSTSESLLVALILNDAEKLTAHGYSTKKAAMDRVLSGLVTVPNPAGWLRLLRAAATGSR